MRYLLTIGFVFTLSVTYSQPETNIDKDRICGQLYNSLKHLGTEKQLSSFRITSDKILRNGFGYSFMQSDYVAGKLKVEKENIWEQDKERISELFKTVSDMVGDSLDFDLSVCVPLKIRNKGANTIISKLDNETLLFFIEKWRKGRRGPGGYIYLFFFDTRDNVEKVFKTTWIE